MSGVRVLQFAWLQTFSVALLLGLMSLTSHAGFFSKDAVFQTSDGAIRGYDPVAYFTEGKPTKGLPTLTYEYKGASWRFASRDNLEKFKSAPEKYTPAYGGYCAYALSEGYTASTDPDAWKIVDGRLFLNYSINVQKRWEKDQARRIVKGDENWPKSKEGKAYLGL